MRLVRPHLRSTLLKGLCAGVLALTLSVAACGSESGPSRSGTGVALAEPSQGGFVYVELRSAHHWSSLRHPERGELELGAMFVHHWGGERDDVAHQLGVRLEEPGLALGTCVRGADLVALPLGDFDEDTGELSVDLMDAGTLLFVLPGRSELLAGELYPEVLPNVSGHHYRRILPLATKSVSTRRVNVLGLGGRDVSAFELAAIRGPAELRWTSVGGWSPVDGPAVVSARDPLVLQWTPGQPRFDTLVRLRWPAWRDRRAGELVCRPRRSGRLTIPRTWLARVPITGAGREVTLTVETTARASLEGPLPGGVLVRVSQSDSVTLQVVR
jgi:hypothetical protein